MPCCVGQCDAFLSHSWHDDGSQKWAALSGWAEEFERVNKRSPRLWLDKVCIDQRNINADLQCLPVFLAGCNLLLVVSGSTYTSRQWCCVELFVYVTILEEDESRLAPIVLTIGSDDNEHERVRNSFRTFDATACECFAEEDKKRMLAVVECCPGGVQGFNSHVRVLATQLFRRKRIHASRVMRPAIFSPVRSFGRLRASCTSGLSMVCPSSAYLTDAAVPDTCGGVTRAASSLALPTASVTRSPVSRRFSGKTPSGDYSQFGPGGDADEIVVAPFSRDAELAEVDVRNTDAFSTVAFQDAVSLKLYTPPLTKKVLSLRATGGVADVSEATSCPNPSSSDRFVCSREAAATFTGSPRDADVNDTAVAGATCDDVVAESTVGVSERSQRLQKRKRLPPSGQRRGQRTPRVQRTPQCQVCHSRQCASFV